MPRLLFVRMFFAAFGLVVMIIINVIMIGKIFQNNSILEGAIDSLVGTDVAGYEGQLRPVVERPTTTTTTTNDNFKPAGGVEGIERKTKQLRNLVVFCALGTRSAVQILQYNVNAHFRANRNKNNKMDDDDMHWDCIVFLYVSEESLGPDLLENIAQTCTITRLPNFRWVHFLMTISPILVQDYDYIAVVLDDVFAPAVGPSAINVPRLIHHMRKYNISSITPTVHGGNWASNYPVVGHDQCVRQVRLLETYFQIFTNDMWTNCFYPLLHFSNPMAYCVDICLAAVCPSRTLAIDESMEMYHIGKEGRNFSIPMEVLQMVVPLSAALNESLLSESPLERGRAKFLVQRRAIKKNDALCQKFNCKGARTKEEADWKSENPFYCTTRWTANRTL